MLWSLTKSREARCVCQARRAAVILSVAKPGPAFNAFLQTWVVWVYVRLLFDNLHSWRNFLVRKFSWLNTQTFWFEIVISLTLKRMIFFVFQCIFIDMGSVSLCAVANLHSWWKFAVYYFVCLFQLGSRWLANEGNWVQASELLFCLLSSPAQLSIQIW